MAQASVLLDVQIWVGAVEHIQKKKSPASIRALSQLSSRESTDATVLLAVLSFISLPLAWGEEIRYGVVNVLTKRRGWRIEEATKWADICEAFCRASGGGVAGSVPRDRSLDRDVALWGLEDREDGQVARTALEAGAVALVTNDGPFLVGRVPTLRLVDFESFYKDMKAIRAKQLPPRTGTRPAA